MKNWATLIMNSREDYLVFFLFFLSPGALNQSLLAQQGSYSYISMVRKDQIIIIPSTYLGD